MSQRGIARCAKAYPAMSYTVTFNGIGLADSDTAQRFATWMGVEVRARVSYLKGWKQVTTQELDQLWLRAKEIWNISDDSASEHKKVLLRKMNEYHRKFKTSLTHIAQEGKDPIFVYKDLNMEDWPAFVFIRNSSAFKEKSAKAKANALKNTDRHRMGRTSYVGLEKKLAPIMQEHGLWTLLIIDRSMEKGYILDSYNKDVKKKKTPGDFVVVNVLNEACQVNLDWTFPKITQQKETWECDYYVMKWILDFFMIIQHEFPDNFSTYFSTTKPIPMVLLMVDYTSKAFYEHHCQPCEERI